jgi:Tol biopolymer transport system component/DNA-binding winged helix-turn-helix (wHTH) protein
MEHADRADATIRFGVFEVDPRAGELRKSGTRIRIQEQPFQLLLALLEHPGELVTREELKRRIWPDDSFGDFDHAVNVAVAKLRATLGDSPEAPRYIETLHRRGYRFVYPLTSLGSPQPIARQPAPADLPADKSWVEVSPDADLAAPAARARQSSRLKMLLAVVCALAVLAGGYLAYRFLQRSKSASDSVKIVQISQWNKPMDNPRLSPDGHAVAFDAPVAGVSQVFLMLTSGGEPLQLTNDQGDKYMDSFSPDGKEVYYGKDLGTDEIWAVPTLGGSSRRVISAKYLVPSPDGSSIFYATGGGQALFRAGKSGLNEEVIYRPEDTSRVYSVRLLFPDGKHLLAAGARYMYGASNRLLKINLATHKSEDLGEVDIAGSSREITWAEPGKSIYLSHTMNGLTNIWKYSFIDRSLTQITFGTGPDFSPMPDPSGRGLYYINGRSIGFLTSYNVRTKQATDITSDDASEPVISADGKHLMYITYFSPQKNDLWVSDLDGSNRLKIASGGRLFSGRWAPDNFHLTFLEDDMAGGKVYVVRSDGSDLRQMSAVAKGDIMDTAWSPDQKSIYVTIYGTAVEPQIWKWSADGSNQEKLVDSCCDISDVDSHGKYLIGPSLSSGGYCVFQLSLSDKKCTSLVPGARTLEVVFAPDGKSFLYAVPSRGQLTIYRQAWTQGKLIGTPQVAISAPFSIPMWVHQDSAYDFSRNLSTIVYTRSSGRADLYLQSQE